jgi:2-polyprenyl-3-methyl-5-hydroxy-6-metoxy-1,4-benzoquinol methylase
VLLTITNSSPPATDLGFVLHKNPAAVRSVDVGFGVAHAFYPEAETGRCTIALLCEVDPVALVRRSRGGPFPLAAYVNDRPYAASSFLSVALRKMFGTALQGRCTQRPELVEARLDLSVRLPVLPCRGGQALLRRLFEPLGYQVSARPIPLDPGFPAWGDSPYADVRISATCRVQDLLGHLYVLLPVLDDDKHYWVTRDEIDKLTGGAGRWLATHPERDVIVRRYLRHQARLAQEALARLADEGGATAGDPADEEEAAGPGEPGGPGEAAGPGEPGGPGEAAGQPGAEHTRLRDLRVAAVTAALTAAGARHVLDLGCGDGRLIAALLHSGQFEEIVGVDASVTALERAARRLRVDEMAPRQRDRVRLIQGALTYRDRRLAGYDAAVLMEVIEHVDPDRLSALEQAVFGGAAPATVIVTTPNAEYNAHYPALAAGALRHPDHRFEWDRPQFRAWAEGVAARHGYTVAFDPVGEDDPQAGPPTQMAVLSR